MALDRLHLGQLTAANWYLTRSWMRIHKFLTILTRHHRAVCFIFRLRNVLNYVLGATTASAFVLQHPRHVELLSNIRPSMSAQNRVSLRLRLVSDCLIFSLNKSPTAFNSFVWIQMVRLILFAQFTLRRRLFGLSLVKHTLSVATRPSHLILLSHRISRLLIRGQLVACPLLVLALWLVTPHWVLLLIKNFYICCHFLKLLFA